MRLVAYLIVFVGCVAMGYLMDVRSKKRVGELQSLVIAFEQLKGEINYRLTPFPEACTYVGGARQDTIRTLFFTFGKILQQGQQTDTYGIWKQVLEEAKPYCSLTERDYKVLEEFGRLPSYSDKEIQKNHIELVMVKMKKLLEQSEEDEEKKGSLYTKMGTLIGACICILLV